MSGKVAKGLRKLAEGDRKKYQALKKFYRQYKFNYKQKEMPFLTMRVQLTKANAFQIEPGKKYLVLISNKDGMLQTADLDHMRKQLEPMNMTVVLLPEGVKYKVVEKDDASPAA